MSKTDNSTLGRAGIILIAVLALACSTPHALAQAETWAAKAPMPTARDALVVGVIDGMLYAVGGEIPSSGPNVALGSVEAYDPRSNSWTSKSVMPTPRYGAGGAVVGGVLYVVGGLDSSNFPTNAVESYNAKSGTWTREAPLPTARAGLVLVALDGSLYSIGGFRPGFNNTNYSTVEEFSPKTNAWIAKAPMPTARCCMAAGVINGLVFVAGGTRYIGHGGTETPGVLEVYDPKQNVWTTGATMPTGRGGAAGDVLDGKLYVAGGILAPLYTYLIQDTVEAYDPDKSSWVTEPSMPTGRLSAGAATIDDTLYVVGGLDRENRVLSVNEAFSPFLAVLIDIKPGDPNNVINLKSAGVVPVAMLSSSSFDATSVDPTTVTLAGAPVVLRGNGSPMTAVADVNGDGFPDLLVYFRTRKLQLTPADTEAVLYGKTYSGEPIRGSDNVKVIN